jgi:hypothetical protein
MSTYTVAQLVCQIQRKLREHIIGSGHPTNYANNDPIWNATSEPVEPVKHPQMDAATGFEPKPVSLFCIVEAK